MKKKSVEEEELNAENQKQEKEEYREGSFSAGINISLHLEIVQQRNCLSVTSSR